MKTIKQLADEIGVSKTAVNKKIDNLGLRNQLSKSENRWFIPESIENTIKESFTGNHKKETVSDNQSETVSTIISTFQAQLEAKDKQIDRLQELLDHEQQLRMVVEQKLLAIQDTQVEPDPVETEEPKRKWWQFFK